LSASFRLSAPAMGPIGRGIGRIGGQRPRHASHPPTAFPQLCASPCTPYPRALLRDEWACAPGKRYQEWAPPAPVEWGWPRAEDSGPPILYLSGLYTLNSTHTPRFSPEIRYPGFWGIMPQKCDNLSTSVLRPAGTLRNLEHDVPKVRHCVLRPVGRSRHITEFRT